MPAFYRATIAEFLDSPLSEVLGQLSLAYAASGFSAQRTSQTRAWDADLLLLQNALSILARMVPAAASWPILLEFPIPRKARRIDVVLLAGSSIVILELKTSVQVAEASRQAEDYALLLHFFHQPSSSRRIIPIIVGPSTQVPKRADLQHFLPIVEAPAYWVERTSFCSWNQLPGHLCNKLADVTYDDPIDAVAWDCGEYRPVPGIIEAALALQSGLGIREIAHSRAARHDVDRLTLLISQMIENAKQNHELAICFVTGVPGSGKTLVGLNLAYGIRPGSEHIAFMSGTGPLVKVLQAALAEDHRLRTKVKSEEAKRKAETLIENVHVFARYYAEENKDRAPADHIIIFDEAQRAWNRTQNFRKFKRDYSEPEMLLKIMERHQDWAVVIALVGGGQEINDGEAGLAEWGRALDQSTRPWNIYASPEAVQGGQSVAGTKLFEEGVRPAKPINIDSQLHLDVSVRSLKAASYSAWVNSVILGDSQGAAAIADQARQNNDSFPTLLTRSLDDARALLRSNTMGEGRCGLVASSGATRMRAEGMEPDSSFHAAYPWHHWYLGQPKDVRSSFQMEVFATEFEIQGLELDWVGVCWGGDFTWSALQGEWLTRKFSKVASKWSRIKAEQQQMYRKNAYRVLLTRARQGIVLYVPAGDAGDPTRNPNEFDATADFLLRCGAILVPASKPQTRTNHRDATLFG